MSVEDFSSLFAIQKAIHDNVIITEEIHKILQDIKPFLNEIDKRISKHQANISMVIVNHDKNPHTFLEKLPKKDSELNEHMDVLYKSVISRLDAIKETLDMVKKNKETDHGPALESINSEHKDDVITGYSSSIPNYATL